MKKSCPDKKKKEDNDDSENDEEDDKSDDSNGVDVDNSPKCIPVAKLPEKLKTKKVVINISDTQYPIVEEIAEELGWTIQRKEGSGNWDVWWTDREIHPETLIKMNFHQKINHFAGIEVLARKNLLGLNLMAMREHFPEQYGFFPETWAIPLEFPKFRAYYDSCPKGKTRTYIVKPEALSQGRGIFLTRTIDEIANGQKYVVQRYVKNPYLLDGLKFDLRIYVLLAGTDPLRLYIYEEGLTRLATKKYEEPTEENLHTSFIHLTNYSLNKNNPNFIYNTSVENMDVGHKRSLSSTYTHLAKKGCDVQSLKQQINDLIIKTFISGLPTISHQYQACQPEEYEGNMCFHIIGVDVMLTSDLKPILIELNHTPSFETGTPLDLKVKKSLICDTFRLMRITSRRKKELFEKAKTILKKRVETGKREIAKGDERKLLIKEAQKIREEEEQDKMGAYTQIYPCSSPEQMEAYQKMIEKAEEVHKSTQEQRRKLIREEQERVKQARKASSEQEKNQEQAAVHPRKFHSTSMHSEKEGSMAESLQLRRHTPDFCAPAKELGSETRQKYEEGAMHNIMHSGQRGILGRKKNKTLLPSVDPLQQREEVIRFSEYMQRYLINNSTPNKIGLVGTNLPGIVNSASHLQHPLEKKKNVEQPRDERKPGAFLIPKTYNIVDSHYCSIQKLADESIRESAHRKNSNLNSIVSHSRQLRGLDSYKQISRKKKD